jgi:hypothetical protein
MAALSRHFLFRQDQVTSAWVRVDAQATDQRPVPVLGLPVEQHRAAAQVAGWDSDPVLDRDPAPEA